MAFCGGNGSGGGSGGKGNSNLSGLGDSHSNSLDGNNKSKRQSVVDLMHFFKSPKSGKASTGLPTGAGMSSSETVVRVGVSATGSPSVSRTRPSFDIRTATAPATSTLYSYAPVTTSAGTSSSQMESSSATSSNSLDLPFRISTSTQSARSPSSESNVDSGWRSETTQNLRDRINELKEAKKKLPPLETLSRSSVSTTNSRPSVSTTQSYELSTPSSSPRTPAITKSPPSSWSPRRLNSSVKRDSLTSLFSSTGSINSRSRLSILDIKKRLKRTTSNESEASPSSVSPTQQSSSRSRHIPLAGLCIQHEDPFVEAGGSSSSRIPREDSDATLVPKKQAESILSRPSHDLRAPPPSLNTTRPYRSASNSEVDPLEERPDLPRAHSADYLTQILSSSSVSSAEQDSASSSISASLASRFSLKRFRSSPTVPSYGDDTVAGSSISPLFKVRSRKFDRAFEFPKDTFQVKYQSIKAKIRKMSGTLDISESTETGKLDKGKGRAVDFEEPTSPTSPSKLMSSRVEKATREIQQLANLRVELGLPYKPSIYTGPTHLSHPNHPFVWDHVNLRCMVCPARPEPGSSKSPGSSPAAGGQASSSHLHPAIRPGFTSTLDLSMYESEGISFGPPSSKGTSDGLDHVHPAHRARLRPILHPGDNNYNVLQPISNPTSMASAPKPVICALCPSTCCMYSSMLRNPRLHLDILRDLIRLTSPSSSIGGTNGRDAYATFVQCSNEECGKVVCPDCASRCRLMGCGSVVCKECRERAREEGLGDGWICDWHDEY